MRFSVPLIALLLSSCEPAAAPAGATRVFIDARGKSVQVPFPPRRIVSLMPSATELLYRVGAGAQVAGVTKYCTFPEEAKSKPRVGDLVVDPESLLALKADLVIGGVSQTGKTLRELEARGFVCYAVEATDVDAIGDVLKRVGEPPLCSTALRIIAILLKQATIVIDSKHGNNWSYFYQNQERRGVNFGRR